MNNPVISGQRIYFRKLTKEDIAGNWLKWFNDPEITRFLSQNHSNTAESFASYLDQVNQSDSDYLFGIISKDSEEHVGNCGLHAIDKTTNQAKLGIVIGEKAYQGKGIGKEALSLLLDYGFNQLALNRIYLKVNAGNTIAAKIYLKCGFTQEGILRKDMFKNGEYSDTIIMSVLRDEFFKQIDMRNKNEVKANR